MSVPSSPPSTPLPATQQLPPAASASPVAVTAHSSATDSAPALKACLRYLTSVPSSASAVLDVDSAFFDCISEMVEGRCSDAQIGAFLALLTVERLTPAILAACARALREHAVPVSLPPSVASCMDIVGTGGDGADSFNVSTASAFLVAASGVSVVKHGNRSSSSKCGSADLIEATGAALSLSSAQAAECVSRTNFAFLFAQNFHPAMRHVSTARKQLGIRTVFNVLGPLSNPCIPQYQLTGVYSAKLGPLFAHSLHRLGVKRAMIVHGEEEGTDELSPHGPSLIWRLAEDGRVDELRVAPTDFGLPAHSLDQLRSGTAQDNVQTLLSILRGEPSAVADWVLMNTSAALVCAGRAADWKEGVAIAREAITNGSALRLLNAYVQTSVEVQQKKKPSILETIAKHRVSLVEAAKSHTPLTALLHSALWKHPPPKLVNVLERLRKSGPMALMAEIKRASPSLGDINVHIDPAQQAVTYAKGGAAVISVLTEPKWFKGSLSDLRAVRHAVDSLPIRPCVLLKDFVLDEYQLVEARVAGADTALLIVAILPLPRLAQLMAVSRSLGMEPLVEVANAAEMATALQAGARLIGVNNRDLHTFAVDASTTNTLAAMIERGEQSSPEDYRVFLAALSGIKTRQDVESYQSAGCEAVLVGETLMRSDNPARTIRELLALPHSPALQPSSAASSTHSLSPQQSSGSLLQAPNGHSRTRSGSLSSLKPVLISPPASPSPHLSPASLHSSHSAATPSSPKLSPSHSSALPPPHIRSTAGDPSVFAPSVLPADNADFNPVSSLSASAQQPASRHAQLTLPAVAATSHSAVQPPLVKVCGLASVSSALMAYEAGADLLGLIFVPSSKRNVSEDVARAMVAAVSAEAASRVRAGVDASTAGPEPVDKRADGHGEHWLTQQATALRAKVAKSRVSAALPLFVGVFVDCSAAEMNRVAEAVGLDLIQLHGNEPPHIAQQLNRPAIRVVHVIPNSTTAEECIQRCQQMTDVAAVLLDTKLSGGASGGSGVTFDWSIAAAVSARFPVLVAGGLTAANVHGAVTRIAPLGVDVSSGVEREDGSVEKDVEKVRAFVREAKRRR